MPVQLPLDDSDRADSDTGIHEVTPELAYKRTRIVNVVFYGLRAAPDRQWVLIDAGILGSHGAIVSAAAHRFGRDSRPAAIILTHGHFDHVGALEQLAEEWDTPIYAHPLEMPYLDGSAAYPPADPSVGGGLIARLSPLFPTGPINVAERLAALPADGTIPHMPGWRWLHTPGHTPGHISLWHDLSEILIAGDAIVTTGQESVYEALVQEPEMHGPPRYLTPDWESAHASVRLLADLGPETVIAGHGRAMRGQHMREALRYLADNFREIAVPDHGRYVRSPERAADGSVYHDPR